MVDELLRIEQRKVLFQPCWQKVSFLKDPIRSVIKFLIVFLLAQCLVIIGDNLTLLDPIFSELLQLSPQFGRSTNIYLKIKVIDYLFVRIESTDWKSFNHCIFKYTIHGIDLLNPCVFTFHLKTIYRIDLTIIFYMLNIQYILSF